MVEDKIHISSPQNREQRRATKPSDPKYTKARWAMQPKAELRRKRKLGRK